jgi:hypothetical protein
VLPPIVVDLGPDVGAREVQIVLDACNQAIVGGVCLSDTLTSDEPARARAFARSQGARSRIVRIEVRLRSTEQPSWLVRELRFAPGDPAIERWRSVGLAIATLVGEGERQQTAEANGEPEPSPPPSRVDPPAAPAPVPAPRVARIEAPAEAPPADVVEPSPPRWEGVFLGVGLLTGPGFDDDVWRFGGQARAGWASSSGWQLLSSIGYSLRASEQTFTAAWFSLQAGVGYRLQLAEHFSSAISLQAGVQQMRFEVLSGGVADTQQRWNPLGSVGVDGWWRPSSAFGVWAGLDAQSIGRRSRLLLEPDRLAATSYPVDLTFAVGVGWWLP